MPPAVPLKTLVRIGAPPQTLFSVWKEKKADLIVMGSRGRGSVESIVMGSVSQYILHHVTAAVTIVRKMEQGQFQFAPLLVFGADGSRHSHGAAR